jgi:AraC-like DNA-binding protein
MILLLDHDCRGIEPERRLAGARKDLPIRNPPMLTHWLSRHAPRTRLARHRHAEGYVAVLLAGGFVEAGDGPRLHVQAGDVIAHSDYEAHQDAFGASGARVLNLPRPLQPTVTYGRVRDPDAVVRVAERDPVEALALVFGSLEPAAAPLDDWPDQLAAALAGDTNVSLGAWARAAGLARQSLSRGFRCAYGITPQRYRLEQRARRTLRLLPGWTGSLSALAAESGFADQAHLTRTLRALTGLTPGQLRVQCVLSRRQEGD